MQRHDRAAFLAGIDPAQQAFRAQQRQEFDNASTVPFSTWRYEIVGTVRDPDARRAAQRRLGPDVLLLHVRVRYALRGIDTIPTMHDQYLALVSRGDHTYLAGDDLLAAVGLPSWDGPWRYGPLGTARSGGALVLGPRTEGTTLRRLAVAADRAASVVRGVWGGATPTAVVLAPTAAAFAALSGSGVRDVEATAVTDSIDPVSNRAVGQRIVLNPAVLPRLSTVGLGIVLRHEITHLATAADTSDTTPRWLVEGVAEYAGNLGSGQPVRTAAGELAADVRAGHVPAELPGDTDFGAGGASAARAYEGAWLACRLIATLIGQDGLVRLYRAIGAAIAPADEAVAAAFRSVLHMSQAAFTARWRAYLRTQL